MDELLPLCDLELVKGFFTLCRKVFDAKNDRIFLYAFAFFVEQRINNAGDDRLYFRTLA
jgi:hypothetical protein